MKKCPVECRLQTRTAANTDDKDRETRIDDDDVDVDDDQEELLNLDDGLIVFVASSFKTTSISYRIPIQTTNALQFTKASSDPTHKKKDFLSHNFLKMKCHFVPHNAK